MRSLTLILTILLLTTTTVVAEAYYRVTGIALTDTLNVRKTASTSADKAGVLAADSKCIRAENCAKGWCKIDFEEGSAYVYDRYLEKMKDSSVCKAKNSGLPTLEEIAAIRAALDAETSPETINKTRTALAALSTPDYLVEIAKNLCSKSLLEKKRAAGKFVSAAHILFASYQTSIAEKINSGSIPLVRITTNSAKGQVIADFFGEKEKATSCRVVLRHANGAEPGISQNIDATVARFMRMGGRLLVASETHNQEALSDEEPYEIDLRYYGSRCKDIYLKTITAKQGSSIKSSALEIALAGSLQAPDYACLPLDEIR
ncbi:SH3 domain-containing protein [Solemya elarraichensis gill symbiont]|nr:SH3 domain-containing protein [Solemya elarraichensis gill symbiont]